MDFEVQNGKLISQFETRSNQFLANFQPIFCYPKWTFKSIWMVYYIEFNSTKI